MMSILSAGNKTEVHLSNATLTCLENLNGYRQARTAIDATAMTALPHRRMDRFPSITPRVLPYQKHDCLETLLSSAEASVPCVVCAVCRVRIML